MSPLYEVIDREIIDDVIDSCYCPLMRQFKIELNSFRMLSGHTHVMVYYIHHYEYSTEESVLTNFLKFFVACSKCLS